jgi:hypothetical protein
VSTANFRARSATELVDGAFQLYRSNFMMFLTLGAIFYVPVLVVQWTMIGIMPRATTMSQVGAIYERMAIVWPLLAIWAAAWYAIIMTLIADIYLGRTPDLGSATSRGISRLVPAIVSSLIKSILVGIGIAFFLLPGIYLALYFFAVPSAAILEPIGLTGALGRSGKLSNGLKGHVLKTYLLMMCLFLAAYVLVIMIAGVVAFFTHSFSTTGTPVLIQFVAALAVIAVYPLWPITAVLLYFDARIRNEGYDIELMAQNVAGAAATAPASAY